MLSQFTGGDPGLRTLSDLSFPFPEGIHAVGRLDYNSEGLLLLTTDTRITKLLFESEIKHNRCYLVQAYKEMDASKFEQLRTGVDFLIKGGITYRTIACEVQSAQRPFWLSEADHELPTSIPHTWLTVTLKEGKYRQVRKMMASIGHKCRRLIRISIEDAMVEDVNSGEVKEVLQADFFRLLHLKQD